jgi:hypothetical protein
MRTYIFCLAALATACVAAPGQQVTRAARDFSAEQQDVVEAIANRYSGTGYRIIEASAYRLVAEIDNNNMMAQALFGTQASGYRVVNRLDCNISSAGAITRVSCQGAIVSNPGNAFENVSYGVNVSTVQQTLDQIAAEHGW